MVLGKDACWEQLHLSGQISGYGVCVSVSVSYTTTSEPDRVCTCVSVSLCIPLHVCEYVCLSVYFVSESVYPWVHICGCACKHALCVCICEPVSISLHLCT